MSIKRNAAITPIPPVVVVVGGGDVGGANFLANRDPDHTAQAVQSGLAVDFL